MRTCLGNRLEGERVVDESVGADAWSALVGAELEMLSNEMLLIVIPSVMETISITMPPYERSPRRATGTRECIHERDPDDGIRRSATTCLSGQIVSIVLHARTIAVAGAAVTGVAMPILVFDISRSPFLTSLAAAGTVLPYLVFGLFAGAWQTESTGGRLSCVRRP